MDQSGATLKTTVQGYRGLQAASQVIVLGKVERDGKVVRLKATGIYVP